MPRDEDIRTELARLKIALTKRKRLDEWSWKTLAFSLSIWCLPTLVSLFIPNTHGTSKPSAQYAWVMFEESMRLLSYVFFVIFGVLFAPWIYVKLGFAPVKTCLTQKQMQMWGITGVETEVARKSTIPLQSDPRVSSSSSFSSSSVPSSLSSASASASSVPTTGTPYHNNQYQSTFRGTTQTNMETMTGSTTPAYRISPSVNSASPSKSWRHRSSGGIPSATPSSSFSNPANFDMSARRGAGLGYVQQEQQGHMQWSPNNTSQHFQDQLQQQQHLQQQLQLSGGSRWGNQQPIHHQYKPSPKNDVINSPGLSLSEIVGRHHGTHHIKEIFAHEALFEHGHGNIHSHWITALKEYISNTLFEQVRDFDLLVGKIVNAMKAENITIDGVFSLNSNTLGVNNANATNLAEVQLIKVLRLEAPEIVMNNFRWDLNAIVQKLSDLGKAASTGPAQLPFGGGGSFLGGFGAGLGAGTGGGIGVLGAKGPGVGQSKIPELMKQYCILYKIFCPLCSDQIIGNHNLEKRRTLDRVRELYAKRSQNLLRDKKIDNDIVMNIFLNKCCQLSMRFQTKDRFVFDIDDISESVPLVPSIYRTLENNSTPHFDVLIPDIHHLNRISVDKGRENCLECIVVFLLCLVQDQEHASAAPREIIMKVFEAETSSSDLKDILKDLYLKENLRRKTYLHASH